MDPNIDYVQGGVLGFVEVTLRPYGLGTAETGNSNSNPTFLYDNDQDSLAPKRTMVQTLRPILTNLSVQYEARKSGVASRLMELCETHVYQTWRMSEIVLEVEDDNERALRFYDKRGYRVVQEDPTSRRYDTNGLVLRQLRCNRKIMRKTLYRNPVGQFGNKSNSDASAENAFGVGKALQRFRDSFFPSL